MEKYPTGIEELDEILGGGLPSNRAYMITGPSHSGKRLLSLLIQKASLIRKEYCLYVTYGQSYRAVLNRYKDLGIDAEKYMESGLLKITDYYSLDTFSLEELKSQLSPIEEKSIKHMLPEDLEDENKKREYIQFQKESINKIGKPGVVIIDSLNERLERTQHDIVLKQWQRFKDKLSVSAGLLSLHLYTPMERDLSSIVEMIRYYEENSIELEITPKGERKIRFRIKMPPTITDSWNKFIIHNNTILIEKITGTIETSILEKSIKVAENCVSEDGRVHPKVGAVIITDDEEIFAFRGEIRDGDHAEYTALERKCVDKNLRGATLITTLEPCTTRPHMKMSGPGPEEPCVYHIIERGVKKVIIGILDPNPKIHGEAYFILKENGVEVEFFPANLSNRIWDQNKNFIEEQRKFKG